MWEKGIELCDELAQQYKEELFNYRNLSKILVRPIFHMVAPPSSAYVYACIDKYKRHAWENTSPVVVCVYANA